MRFLLFPTAAVPSARARGPGPTWAERQAGRALGTPLTAVVGSACLVMLVTWVPHYLTWPWWSDLDVFATMAQAWRSGIEPYRDLIEVNFPGQLYLFVALDWAFGV